MNTVPPTGHVQFEAQFDSDEREGTGAFCWVLLAMIVAGVTLLVVVFGARL